MGELHACFASLRAIAKYLEGSGLESICTEAGLYAPSTIRQIFTGKWFKRSVTFHITNTMAWYDLIFQASLQQEGMEAVVLKCRNFCDKLHIRQDGVNELFEEVRSIFVEKFQAALDQEFGEMARFLLNYTKQVESLLHFIRASRQGDWELYLAALEDNVKYYFAHDLYKYARFTPVYLSQMQLFKTTDQEAWKDLKGGDFMVTKSGIPFTNLFVDQTLEHLSENWKLQEESLVLRRMKMRSINYSWLLLS